MTTRALAAAVLALAIPAALPAHDGPPFEILSERAVGPVTLSVWADPDVGTGTFFFYLEPLGPGRAMPESCDVQIFVRPASGRLAETAHRATARRVRKGVSDFEALVPFDQAERWDVRVLVVSPQGGGEARTQVDVTPPGQGAALDFALYLFPFVAVAALFVIAVVRGRKGAAA